MPHPDHARRETEDGRSSQGRLNPTGHLNQHTPHLILGILRTTRVEHAVVCPESPFRGIPQRHARRRSWWRPPRPASQARPGRLGRQHTDHGSTDGKSHKIRRVIKQRRIVSVNRDRFSPITRVHRVGVIPTPGVPADCSASSRPHQERREPHVDTGTGVQRHHRPHAPSIKPHQLPCIDVQLRHDTICSHLYADRCSSHQGLVLLPFSFILTGPRTMTAQAQCTKQAITAQESLQVVRRMILATIMGLIPSAQSMSCTSCVPRATGHAGSDAAESGELDGRDLPDTAWTAS